jgi:eukaryotic translation initiation factor 2C
LDSCRGCLLVRQSYFHNDQKFVAEVGGGVLGCRGFNSSFRTTQGGLSSTLVRSFTILFYIYLSLNFFFLLLVLLPFYPDVSTTMIIQPGPVVDFLTSNQNVRDPFSLDWSKVIKSASFFYLST